ncbi:hypothetical protein [Kitasatospora sp. NPDC088134]|uniref:hypothetical protein n=1 Tax=Kitasatospora sp. NPDC088134 TaxID=3364071 RepID=UPI0037F48270
MLLPTPRPGFWAAYLLWLAEGEDFEPEPATFGADGADADAAHQRLSDPAARPVLRLPMQHGHSILIIHRNFAEDGGVDYYVAHPDRDRPRSLAGIEGHFAGPGLAWRELAHVARHSGNGPGSTDPDARRLFLPAVLGDVDLSADATATVARALASIGTPPEAAATPADALLDHSFWDGETWFFEGSSPLSGASTAPPTSAACCSAAAPTAPAASASGPYPDQDARLAEALGTAD